MIALNVEMLSLFCLPHLFDESAWRMLSVCFASMMVQFRVPANTTGTTWSHCANFK